MYSGRTGQVVHLGEKVVAKLYHHSIGGDAISREARALHAARSVGVRVPRILACHPAERKLLLEYVEGNTMLQALLAAKEDFGCLGRMLGRIHGEIHRRCAAGLHRYRLRALRDLRPRPEDACAAPMSVPMDSCSALLHGDLHPGNIILAKDGPVVIDWADASTGDPAADIARTLLLLVLARDTGIPHLGPAQLMALLDAYVLGYCGIARIPRGRVRRWWPIVTRMRLREGLPHEVGVLTTDPPGCPI